MAKRVVVTGIGVVSPIGNNVEDMWASIKAGKHGIGVVTRFDIEGSKAIMAAEVKDYDFGDKRAAKRLDRSNQMAITAAREAYKDAGLICGKEDDPADYNVDPNRFGVYGSTGIGGVTTFENEVTKCVTKGNLNRGSAMLVPDRTSVV